MHAGPRSLVSITFDARGHLADFTRETVQALASRVADDANIEPAAVNGSVTALGPSSVQISIDIAVYDDELARNVFHELKPRLDTLQRASEWFGMKALHTSIRRTALTGGGGSDNVQEPVAAKPAWMSIFGTRSEASNVEQADSATSPAPTSAPPASAADSGSNVTEPLFSVQGYYRDWHAMKHLHLVWLLPVLAFLLLTCGCVWYCTTHREVNETPKEVAAAAALKDERDGPGLFALVDEDDVAEVVAARQHSGRRPPTPGTFGGFR